LTFAAKNLWLKSSPNFYRVTGFPKVPDHYKPGEHYKYKFEQFSASLNPEVIETDVVIVGSGCGGGVCAKNLAEGGHKVLVVDKGYYFTPSQLPMSEAAGGIHLFYNGGIFSSDDGSVPIVAGSTWGGQFMFHSIQFSIATSDSLTYLESFWNQNNSQAYQISLSRSVLL